MAALYEVINNKAVLVGGKPVVIADSLTSTDTNKALSANQGRILNEKIGIILISDNIPMSDVSYTFTDPSIKEDSIIDIYDTIYGFSPKTVTVNNGSCVITFDAQTTTHQIKIKIQ